MKRIDTRGLGNKEKDLLLAELLVNLAVFIAQLETIFEKFGVLQKRE